MMTRLGDFFSIGPAACAAFKHWPALDAEHKAASRLPYISYYLLTGERFVEHKPMTAVTTDGHGHPYETLLEWHRHHRPTLQAILLRQLNAIGNKVEYGRRAITYSETNTRGMVELENGEKLEADVVVAADGLGTCSYDLVLGHQVRARSSGYAVYRTAFPVDIITADPELAEHFKLLPIPGTTPIEMWLG